MRTVLMVMGIIAMFIGAIWFGQGMGFFPYPASSFMVNQGQWAHFGGEMALTGLVLIVLSQRGTKKAAVDEEDTPPPAKGGEHKT